MVQIGPEQIELIYDYGVHLSGTLVWFDPTRAREFSLLSSARHHLGDRQKRVLMSEPTSRLLSAVSGKRARGLVSPFHRPFTLGNLRIEMFPSGYMWGASSFRVTLGSGHTVVYSGPFASQRNRTAEKPEIMNCDTLILDATYGHPDDRHPPQANVEASILDWTQQTLANGDMPVILVANPGKAQDLVQALGQAETPIRVHRQIHAYNRGYQALGIDLPDTRQFRGAPSKGEVLIWPSHLKKSTSIRNLKRVKFAALTGRDDIAGVTRRMRVANVFPWSVRSDYDGLLKYVKKCKPGRIITVGRHAERLASELSQKGYTAEALPLQPQLRLI